MSFHIFTIRTLCIVFLSILSLSLPAQTNKKIRSLQRQQSTLKHNIAQQEKMLKSTKKDVNSQLANLQVINVQIEGQQKYVNGIHAELTELSTTISGLEQQLRLLEADLAVCKRRYQRSVSYMFRNKSSLSKWQFILSAKNFRQMYRRLHYMTQFSRYQRAQAEVIRQKEAQVQAKRNELLGVKTEKNRANYKVNNRSDNRSSTTSINDKRNCKPLLLNSVAKRNNSMHASTNSFSKRSLLRNDAAKPKRNDAARPNSLDKLKPKHNANKPHARRRHARRPNASGMRPLLAVPRQQRPIPID